MKVGRREFLRLVGSAAVSTVVLVKGEGTAKVEEIKKTETSSGDPSWRPVRNVLTRVYLIELPPKYDCDYYCAISQGSQVHKWTDPITGVSHHAIMEWYDHGLHTYLMVDGFRVGEVLSKDVPDPGAYLRSIWSCGPLAAAYMIAGLEKL